MKKTILCLLGITMFLAAILPILAETVAYDKYLTAADVEKVSGLKGLTQKVFSHELIFSGNKKLVLDVSFEGAKFYKLYKGTKDYVKGEVAEVGEEAFYGPAANPQHILIFRKKDFCVTLYTYRNDPSKTILTMDQLIALGKIAASRI
jgi:hypothetical protein